MAKLDLALVVRTVDQATRPLRRIQKTMRDVGRQTGLDRVGRRLRDVGRQLGRVGTEAATFARRFALVTAGIAAGLGVFVGRYAAAGDRIAKMSKRVGLSAKELQRLQFAFDIGGVSAEQSGRALEYFANVIGEAQRGTAEYADIFRDMGISLRKEDGTLKTTRELLDEVADGFARNANAEAKATAARKLFGRGGTPLINSLNEGSKGLQELGDEAERYGLISEEEAARSEEFIDAMTRLKTAITGVGNALGADLIPKLLPALESMKEWVVENRAGIVEKMSTAISDLGDMFDWIGEALGDALYQLKIWNYWAGERIPLYDETIGKLAEWAGELGIVRGAAILLGVWLGKGLVMAIIGLFRPLALLGWAILTAAGRMLWLAATVVFVVGKALWGLVLRAIPAAIGAFSSVDRRHARQPARARHHGADRPRRVARLYLLSSRHGLRKRRALRHHRAVRVRERHVLVDRAPMGKRDGCRRRAGLARFDSRLQPMEYDGRLVGRRGHVLRGHLGGHRGRGRRVGVEIRA